MKKLEILTNIKLSEIVEEIDGQLSHEEILEFIKSIDVVVADLDFTKQLHGYFDKEMKKLIDEELNEKS